MEILLLVAISLALASASIIGMLALSANKTMDQKLGLLAEKLL